MVEYCFKNIWIFEKLDEKIKPSYSCLCPLDIPKSPLYMRSTALALSPKLQTMGSLTLSLYQSFSLRELKTAKLLNIQDWPRQCLCLLLGNTFSETGKSCVSTSVDIAADHINSWSFLNSLFHRSPSQSPRNLTYTLLEDWNQKS